MSALFELPAPLVVARVGGGLAGVTKGAPRVGYFQSHVEEAEPKPFVRALSCALRVSARGEMAGRLFLDAFDVWISKEEQDQTRAALEEAARSLEDPTVIALLAGAAPGEGGYAAPVKGSLAAEGETLGRRKTLGRKASGDLLDRLLLDPDPLVIRNVLLNPRLNEQLALRIATRRPVAGAILEEVARSRFRTRATVRRAVVMNPNCPPGVASRILVGMSRQEAIQVAHDENLDDHVRQVARDVLAAKFG